MSDPNFWKDQYQHSWSQSQQKEHMIARRIEAETGHNVVPIGLGAGSDQYLPGTAKAQGFERGGADLQIDGTNIVLEVTGPLSKRVGPQSPLWLRPDKVSSARAHHPDLETWVIHHLAQNGLMRVICLNDDFFRYQDMGVFPMVQPTIRGARETYLEIPSNHSVIQPWQALINRLK